MIVRKKLEENGKNRWISGMQNKSTIKWYRRKDKPEALHWHVGG